MFDLHEDIENSIECRMLAVLVEDKILDDGPKFAARALSLALPLVLPLAFLCTSLK